jgi:uncharacterized protein YhfF/RimJ/RimL family protein N-acetyltransferase
MSPTIRKVTEADVRGFATWRYDTPYDVYNITMPPEDAVRYFLSDDTACHVLVEDDGALAGFCTFGSDARVPGGNYGEAALDIGLGIRPSFTGQGRGAAFVRAVIEHAVGSLGADRLRVTVAAWNERALRVWRGAGFTEEQKFEAAAGVMGGGGFFVLSRDGTPINASAEAMWSEYAAATGSEAGYTAWAFGPSEDPEPATELGLLVRDGPKRATTSLVAEYQEDDDPLPEVNDFSVVLDGGGTALCIIRTTQVDVCAFGEVDEQFAWDEGEGDRSLGYWRRVHIEAFSRDDFVVDDETPVVLERFDLVWPR